jgi:hypothetical protein
LTWNNSSSTLSSSTVCGTTLVRAPVLCASTCVTATKTCSNELVVGQNYSGSDAITHLRNCSENANEEIHLSFQNKNESSEWKSSLNIASRLINNTSGSECGLFYLHKTTNGVCEVSICVDPNNRVLIPGGLYTNNSSNICAGGCICAASCVQSPILCATDILESNCVYANACVDSQFLVVGSVTSGDSNVSYFRNCSQKAGDNVTMVHVLRDSSGNWQNTANLTSSFEDNTAGATCSNINLYRYCNNSSPILVLRTQNDNSLCIATKACSPILYGVALVCSPTICATTVSCSPLAKADYVCVCAGYLGIGTGTGNAYTSGHDFNGIQMHTWYNTGDMRASHIRLYGSYKGFGVEPSTLTYHTHTKHKFYGLGETGVPGDHDPGINIACISADHDNGFTGIYSNYDVVSCSDCRGKTNIATVDNALEKVTKLQGRTYNAAGVNGKSYGLVAQEVAPIVPELVYSGNNESSYGLKYQNMAALFVEAIKEQQSEIQDLKNKLESLSQKT